MVSDIMDTLYDCLQALSINVGDNPRTALKTFCHRESKSFILLCVVSLQPRNHQIKEEYVTKNKDGREKLCHEMSHDMSKPTKRVCAQRRLRSAWVSTQSDQSLRCALSG